MVQTKALLKLTTKTSDATYAEGASKQSTA